MGLPLKAHAATSGTKLARVFLAAPARVMRPAWVPNAGLVRYSGPLAQSTATRVRGLNSYQE